MPSEARAKYLLNWVQPFIKLGHLGPFIKAQFCKMKVQPSIKLGHLDPFHKSQILFVNLKFDRKLD